MSKSGPPRRERTGVDTEDRIMETFASMSVWAQRNRRLATMLVVGVVLMAAAGIYYVRYRAQLAERAAVRLDEIRLTTRAAAPAQIRDELGVFIDQFGSARQADEARLMLAELELQRDSADRAIRILEPVADPAGGPMGVHAAMMLAIAEEQRGDRDGAVRRYRRLAESAPFEFQRRDAKAAVARLEYYAGNYREAEQLYGELAEDDEAGDDQAFYRVRLGEVRARAAADLPPPELPAVTASSGDLGSPPADSVAPSDAEAPVGDPAGDDGDNADGRSQ